MKGRQAKNNRRERALARTELRAAQLGGQVETIKAHLKNARNEKNGELIVQLETQLKPLEDKLSKSYTVIENTRKNIRSY